MIDGWTCALKPNRSAMCTGQQALEILFPVTNAKQQSLIALNINFVKMFETPVVNYHQKHV